MRTEIKASYETTVPQKISQVATLGHGEIFFFLLIIIPLFFSPLTQLFKELIKVFRTLHLPGAGEIRDFALHVRLQVICGFMLINCQVRTWSLCASKTFQSSLSESGLCAPDGLTLPA